MVYVKNMYILYNHLIQLYLHLEVTYKINWDEEQKKQKKKNQKDEEEVDQRLFLFRDSYYNII